MSIHVARQDITRIQVDAIVNAANGHLRNGGGVARAIEVAAGPEFARECHEHPFIETGQAGVTSAGKLPARWVIHIVGPVWHGGEEHEAEKLSSCYRAMINQAAALGATTLATPSISTGIYGYPLAPAARIAVDSLRAALAEQDVVQQVTVCVIDDATHAAFQNALQS